MRGLLFILQQVNVSDQILALLSQTMRELYPSVDTGPGTISRDWLLVPTSILLEIPQGELNTVKQAQSIANYNDLSAEEMNALMANLYVYRDEGVHPQVQVELGFAEPVQVSFDENTIFQTSDGSKQYRSRRAFRASAQQLAANRQTDGLYYTSLIDAEAVEPGQSQAVVIGELVSMPFSPLGLERVNNPIASAWGADPETNADLYDRAPLALSTKAEIEAVLREELPSGTEFGRIYTPDIQDKWWYRGPVKKFDQMASGHELDESQVRVSNAFMDLGHLSPDVILREHNRLVSAPERMGLSGFILGKQTTKDMASRAFKNMRVQGGELRRIRKVFPDFRYGEGPRLSRGERRRMTQALERDFENNSFMGRRTPDLGVDQEGAVLPIDPRAAAGRRRVLGGPGAGHRPVPHRRFHLLS